MMSGDLRTRASFPCDNGDFNMVTVAAVKIKKIHIYGYHREIGLWLILQEDEYCHGDELQTLSITWHIVW